MQVGTTRDLTDISEHLQNAPSSAGTVCSGIVGRRHELFSDTV
jgi:hypothetical protein